MIKYNGIKIDFNRDALLTEQGLTLLEDYYLQDGEHSPQQSFARAAVCFSNGDLELAQRIYDAVSQQWFMYSSPVLANATLEGEKVGGLPISCFLTYVPDTVEGLIEHQAELAWLSVKGGGVGSHWSDVRAISDKAPGPVPFIKVADSGMNAYKQGKTRRGSYAAYMDISHPDIIEFINIRMPTGGDANRKAFNINNAVNIPDVFMRKVLSDEPWELRCPHTNEVTDVMPARTLWERVLDTRFKTGEPYIHWIDQSNRAMPQPLKDKGLEIKGSNLCSEITLPTNEDRTAVCCLSSVNLEKYDEWKDMGLIEDLITYLDNVLQFFIDNAPKQLAKAKYSAERERSLGLGAFGFHAYLQKNNIPFESAQATAVNHQMFKHMQDGSIKQTTLLGSEKGEYLDGIGCGRRNSHMLAIAPNANSSIIANRSSPSIEPYKSNAFTHRTRAGTHLCKNKYLAKVLEEYRIIIGESERNGVEAQWSDIITNEGSVQHLPYLSDWEKDVYKTAFELNQLWIVQHAGDRQQYICQAQSVNVFFPAGTDRLVVNSVHLKAYEAGCKTLYYLRTSSTAAAEKVGTKVERNALIDGPDCLACEG